MSGPDEALPQDVASAAVAEISLDGTVRAASPSFAGRLGQDPDALQGRPLADLGIEEEGVTALLQHATSGRPAGEAALVLHRVDTGCSSVVQVFWSLARDAEGAATHVYLVLTEQTSDLLFGGSGMATVLLDHAADATWAADGEGTIVAITARPLQRFGLTPEVVVGTALLEWIHPDDAPAFAAAWDRLVARESASEVVECRLELPEWPEIWVQERLVDLRDDPHVRAICGTVVDITGRRRAEQRRALQDRRLRAGFDQSGVPQGVLSTEGRFVEVNTALCGLLHRSRDALVGTRIRDITHPSDSGRADAILDRLFAGEVDSAQVERVLIGPGGRPTPVFVDVAALRDEHGAVDAVVGHLHDLSALRSAELRQRQQEDFFLALSRNASDLAVVTDAENQVLYASPTLRNILGHEPVDVIGSVAFAFVHPDDAAAVRAVSDEVLLNGGTRTFAARVRAADDSWRWLEGTTTNLLDTPVGGLVTNLRDVTDRRHVERQLELANQRYHDVFASTSLGILLITLDSEILEVNEAFGRLVGYSRDELLGSAAHRLIADQTLTLQQRQARAGARGSAGYEIEEVFLHRDGTEVPALVTVNLIEQPGGEGQISLVVRDQTRLKELQDQLLRGERMEAAGRVAAGVVHDTNNILAAVSGYAEMLATAVAGQTEAERYLAGISRSIDRARDMVTQMLAFTRGQHLAVAAIDLRDVVVDLEDMLQRLLPRDVRLTVDTAPAPTVADPSQVRQVVLNLVVNARDAVQGDGEVHLSTGVREVQEDHVLPPGTYAVLSVRDDGPGMKDAIARRCFEPFFSTRVAQGGSGLGLSTAHGVARQSGGDLRVRTAPGEGATFELLLPCAEAGAEPPAPESTPAAAAAAVGGEHILVAEDDEAYRSIVVEVLTRAGYQVTAVADGQAALDADVLPDLLLTDVEMPGVEGDELGAALRQRDPLLPVVFLSGRAVAPALDGATFLRKPATTEALLDAVAAGLRRRRAP